MKKCPFCNADIEENAAFCFYCMTTLEDKETVSAQRNKIKTKFAVLIVSVVLVLLFVVVGGALWVFGEDNKNTFPSATDDEYSTTLTSSLTQTTVDLPRESVAGEYEEASEASEYPEEEKGNTSVRSTDYLVDEDKSTAHNKVGTETVPVHTQEQTESILSEEKPSESSSVYLYRQAQYGDDFSVSYPFTEDDVVITGVKSAVSDGVYVIPAEIDGKAVRAVMGLAFSDESICNTVKKVVVPTTVKTIHGNAFANCRNLADIYFCGNSIYTEVTAFPEMSERSATLTIHCSLNCSDRNLRYYRNSASYYGAVYKEYNGGEYN